MSDKWWVWWLPMVAGRTVWRYCVKLKAGMRAERVDSGSFS